jgi:hypothetical protein
MTTTISGTSGITFPAGGAGNTAGTVVGTTDTQTLTNKTLTSPTIASPTFSGTPTGSLLVFGTAVASTSGTSIDFTIPTWANKITVMFSGVSLSGSASYLVQGGNSGGIVSSGYVSTSNHVDNAGGSTGSNSTAGFLIFSNLSTYTVSGAMTLLNITGSVWVASHTFKENTSLICFGGGNGTISSLTTIRITTNGADTFTAGTVNVMYE